MEQSTRWADYRSQTQRHTGTYRQKHKHADKHARARAHTHTERERERERERGREREFRTKEGLDDEPKTLTQARTDLMHEEPSGLFVLPLRLLVFRAAFLRFSQLVTIQILAEGVCGGSWCIFALACSSGNSLINEAIKLLDEEAFDQSIKQAIDSPL